MKTKIKAEIQHVIDKARALFNRKEIIGVRFIDNEKNTKRDLYEKFLDEQIHIDHAGECLPDVPCDIFPLTKIKIFRNRVTLIAKDVNMTYSNVYILTIYKR